MDTQGSNAACQSRNAKVGLRIRTQVPPSEVPRSPLGGSEFFEKDMDWDETGETRV